MIKEKEHQLKVCETLDRLNKLFVYCAENNMRMIGYGDDDCYEHLFDKYTLEYSPEYNSVMLRTRYSKVEILVDFDDYSPDDTVFEILSHCLQECRFLVDHTNTCLEILKENK